MTVKVSTNSDDWTRAILAEHRALLAGYPEFMTPEHVAEVTGWSVGYIRRLCREGVIPAVKPVNLRGGKWFVSKPRLIEWMGGGHEQA